MFDTYLLNERMLILRIINIHDTYVLQAIRTDKDFGLLRGCLWTKKDSSQSQEAKGRHIVGTYQQKRADDGGQSPRKLGRDSGK